MVRQARARGTTKPAARRPVSARVRSIDRVDDSAQQPRRPGARAGRWAGCWASRCISTPSMLLLAVLVTVVYGGYVRAELDLSPAARRTLVGLGFVVCLLGSVLLHELGHALTARRLRHRRARDHPGAARRLDRDGPGRAQPAGRRAGLAGRAGRLAGARRARHGRRRCALPDRTAGRADRLPAGRQQHPGGGLQRAAGAAAGRRAGAAGRAVGADQGPQPGHRGGRLGRAGCIAARHRAWSSLLALPAAACHAVRAGLHAAGGRSPCGRAPGSRSGWRG